MRAQPVAARPHARAPTPRTFLFPPQRHLLSGLRLWVIIGFAVRCGGARRGGA